MQFWISKRKIATNLEDVLTVADFTLGFGFYTLALLVDSYHLNTKQYFIVNYSFSWLAQNLKQQVKDSEHSITFSITNLIYKIRFCYVSRFIYLFKVGRVKPNF